MKFNVLIIIYLVCHFACIRGRKIRNLKKLIPKINYVLKDADAITKLPREKIPYTDPRKAIEDWISPDGSFLESSEEVEVSELVFNEPEPVKSLHKPVNWNAYHVPFKYPYSSYGSVDKHIASAYQVRPKDIYELISALDISKIQEYPKNFKKLLKVILQICQSESVGNSKLSTLYTILKAFNNSPPSENLVDIILKLMKIVSKHSNVNTSYEFSKTLASVKDITNIILKIIQQSKKNSDVTDPLKVIIPIIETLPNTYQEKIFKDLLTSDQRHTLKNTFQDHSSPNLSSKKYYDLSRIALKLYLRNPKHFKTLSRIIYLLADSDLVKYNKNSNRVMQFILRQLRLPGIHNAVYRLGHTTLSPANANFVITSFFKNIQEMFSDKTNFSYNNTLAKSKNKILTKSENFQSENNWTKALNTLASFLDKILTKHENSKSQKDSEESYPSYHYSRYKDTNKTLKKSENLKILKKAKHKETLKNAENMRIWTKAGNSKYQKDSAESLPLFYNSLYKDTNQTLNKSKNLKILKKSKHKKAFTNVDNKRMWKKSGNLESQKHSGESYLSFYDSHYKVTNKTLTKSEKKAKRKKALTNTKNKKILRKPKNSESQQDSAEYYTLFSYPLPKDRTDKTFTEPGNSKFQKDSATPHSLLYSSSYEDKTNKKSKILKILKRTKQKKTTNTNNKKSWTTSEYSKSKKDFAKYPKPGFDALNNSVNINESFYPSKIWGDSHQYLGNDESSSNSLLTNKQLNNNMFLQILKIVSDTANNSDPSIFDDHSVPFGSDLTGLAPYNMLPCNRPAPIELPSSLDTVNPFKILKKDAPRKAYPLQIKTQ
ncbi:uncharacterized protein [Diabrotica undecimpunctata]|uniref:uncharacterized protein n=1 Tax=Diabrotica undecimpunctata TaxID=50387 RepID=UPI003B64128D